MQRVNDADELEARWQREMLARDIDRFLIMQQETHNQQQNTRQNNIITQYYINYLSKIKQFLNIVLIRLPIIYICDNLFTNSVYFYNYVEYLNVFDTFVLYFLFKLLTIAGKFYII